MSIKKDEKLNEKAKKYMAHGQYKKAIEVLEKIQETELPEAKYINLGICYRKLKEFNKAIECCNLAFQTGGEAWRYYNNLANIYSDLKEPETEFIFCKKAFELKNDDPIVINNLANIYYKRWQFDKALEIFSHMDEEKLNSDDFKDERDLIYSFWGNIYCYGTKDYKKALEYYNKVKFKNFKIFNKIVFAHFKILKSGFSDIFQSVLGALIKPSLAIVIALASLYCLVSELWQLFFTNKYDKYTKKGEKNE